MAVRFGLGAQGDERIDILVISTTSCHHIPIMAYTIRSIHDPYHKRILSIEEGSQIYRELRVKAQKAGYLSPTYIYYFFLSMVDFVAFGFSLLLIYKAQSLLAVIGASLCVGFWTVHLGGLTHDFGHRQVFRSPLLNDIFGMFVGLLTATPYKVWKFNHNLHHAHPNEQEKDPDVDSFFTFVEDRETHKTGFKGFVRRNQHIMYFPLMCFAGASFRIKGLIHLIKEFKPRPWLDIIVLAIGILAWFVGPFFIFPFWKALLFIIIYNAIGGLYLGNIFAPNHKGMPQLRPDVEYSFFEQQVITARNVKFNPIIDYIMLGLNYQVEHHLFPSASRLYLHDLHKITAPLCAKYHMSIEEMNIVETNRFIFDESKVVALAARREYAALHAQS